MTGWKIERDWPAKPAAGSDRDAAYAFEITAQGREARQVTVEYAAPSRLASPSHARRILGPYLEGDDPPRRLIVSRDGDVRAAE